MSALNIETLITERAWAPGKGMSGWDSEANYCGGRRPDWVIGFSQTRDSDHLDQSNFAVALDTLGGESEGTVEVVRIGHWACGWVEQILVHRDATEKLQVLLKLLDDYDSYPVLDEEDFSARETEAADECFESNRSTFAAELATYLGREDLTGLNPEHVTDVLLNLWDEECCYGGIENAWLDAREFDRHVEARRWELTRAVREDGNIVALRLLRKAGVRMTSNRKGR